VDGNQPVAVLAVRVGVRVVGREEESRGARHIPTARSCRGKEKRRRGMKKSFK